MLGKCILWQVPGEAPGTANSATFLPLKMASVDLTCGPSAVITRNFASGSLSPTLIVIVHFSSTVWVVLRLRSRGAQYRVPRKWQSGAPRALAGVPSARWPGGSGRGFLSVAQLPAQYLSDIGLRQLGPEF